MYSKYDIDFKKECYDKHFKDYKDYLKSNYNNIPSVYDDSVGEYIKNFDFAYYKNLDFINSFPEYDCCRLLDLSRKRKTSRVKKKISSFIESGNAIFVTLTFSDDVLSRTSKLTRRRYVSRYLKEFSSQYVANIDYGGKKGREHYHAVVTDDLVLKKWRYGLINVERTRTKGNDIARISRYITKLSLHSLKSSTTNIDRLIYSRDILK